MLVGDPLSLAPCFSWVLHGNRTIFNRFNGFSGQAMHTPDLLGNWWETVETVRTLVAWSPHTPLKQGVNERSHRLEKSEMRIPFVL